MGRYFRSIAFCLPLVAAGCDGGEGDHHHDPEALEEADELLADLQAKNYRSFARAPGWEMPRAPATSPHHGDFVDIYVNDVMTGTIEAGFSGKWPEKAIIVKDGWKDAEGKDLNQIAIMRKDTEGWFWAEYGADGKAFEAGHEYDECLGCHTSSNDHVLSF